MVDNFDNLDVTTIKTSPSYTNKTIHLNRTKVENKLQHTLGE